YCVMEMPSFDKLYKEYGDRVNFMMVDLCDGVQETQGKANAFIATKGYTFPVYFDTDGTAQTAYQAYSIPLTVFVDQEGNLQAKHPGAMDEETLRYYIENLLGGNF
ncbi:MAG: TlpA family protein disulfide reductase, partial [Clostridia bacterium]|nr:TlpA family protein disulfide reductase [Clostridia bacterium]